MNSTFLRATLLSIIGLTFSAIIQAQQLKFGDIPKDQLEMMVYDADSTADAIVLFDVAEASVDGNLEVKMKRHVRIKILTDKGLERADVALAFRHGLPEQRISRLKVQSYELQSNGKIKTNKLGRRDSFVEEESENWSNLKFVVPKLTKGGIFEYEFEWMSTSIYDLPDWFFQKEIPVVWSEYKVRIPEWYNYLVLKRSYWNFHTDRQFPYNDTFLFRVSQSNGYTQSINQNLGGMSRTQAVSFRGTEYHWVQKDLPAIKSEPHMKAPIDYYSQLRFQLSSVQFPNSKPESFLNTWPEFVKALEEHDDFGKRFKEDSYFASIAKRLTKNDSTQTEKAITLYQHTRDKLNWDKTFRVFADQKLEDAYIRGELNSGEMNMVLAQLLKGVEIEVSPAVLSTRNNGEIIGNYPIAAQFNHMVLEAELDGKKVALDATEKNRPYNILPTFVLSEKAFVVDGTKSRWINLENEAKNKLTELQMIKLHPDGMITGELSANKTGQFSFSSREELRNDSDENQSSFDRVENIVIDSVVVASGSENEALKYKVHFNIKDHVNVNSQVVYFNPNMFNDDFENPFKLKQRTYPVDFNYPFNTLKIVNIEIPEGWEVDELPSSVLHRLQRNKGEYKRLISANGNLITINYTLTINETRFLPNEYEDLKAMFELMDNSINESIVLKRSI